MISPHPCPLTAPTRAHENVVNGQSLSRRAPHDQRPRTTTNDDDRRPTTDDRRRNHPHRRAHTTRTTRTTTHGGHRPRTNFACIAALDVDGAPLIAPMRRAVPTRVTSIGGWTSFGHAKPMRNPCETHARTHARDRSIDRSIDRYRYRYRYRYRPRPRGRDRCRGADTGPPLVCTSTILCVCMGKQ